MKTAFLKPFAVLVTTVATTGVWGWPNRDPGNYVSGSISGDSVFNKNGVYNSLIILS